MTKTPWQQPNFEQTPKKWVAVGIGTVVLLTVGGVVVGNQIGHNNASSPASSVSYMPTLLPSSTVETSSAIPTATTIYTSPKPTPTVSEQSSTPNVGKYPDVTGLQGKVGHSKESEQEWILWGKAALTKNINFIDLSCAKGYPEANLVVVTVDNTISKTYPTYGYPDAAKEFCAGTTVSIESISGAYVTFLGLALAKAQIDRATSTPS